jgi:DNA mismatch endonuclease (patch repair protein)
MPSRERDASKVHTSQRRPKRKTGLVLDTDPVTSARLSRIRQRDTKPEMIVRRHLSSVGLRYRVHNRDLPGSPDIANRKRRWAVFVHGCFWHHHGGCSRATIPKRNSAFWIDKFSANKARDSENIRRLRKMGIRTFVVWECQTSTEKSMERATRRLVDPVQELGCVHATGPGR